jgi:hypothetical protein
MGAGDPPRHVCSQNTNTARTHGHTVPAAFLQQQQQRHAHTQNPEKSLSSIVCLIVDSLHVPAAAVGAMNTRPQTIASSRHKPSITCEASGSFATSLHCVGPAAPTLNPRPKPYVRRQFGACTGVRAAATAHLHIVALADVVDVRGDGGVGADPVLLHEPDQLRLRQVIRRRRLATVQLHLRQRQHLALAQRRQRVAVRDLRWGGPGGESPK